MKVVEYRITKIFIIVVQVQVQVPSFTLIQLQYNNNKEEEVKTELTIHGIKHNKEKKSV